LPLHPATRRAAAFMIERSPSMLRLLPPTPVVSSQPRRVVILFFMMP
jgi:hypothetical protein